MTGWTHEGWRKQVVTSHSLDGYLRSSSGC
jgi:hypothetical protein